MFQRSAAPHFFLSGVADQDSCNKICPKLLIRPFFGCCLRTSFFRQDVTQQVAETARPHYR